MTTEKLRFDFSGEGPLCGWRSRLTAVLALCAASVLWTPVLTAQEAENAKPEALLILDSSRSMWGQIEGINKIVSARSVLGRAAKQLEGKSRYGLMAYGHRQSAGCRDIETLLPLGEHKAGEMAKIADRIKPKGSTPIASALNEAAKAFTDDKRRSSIILIADGLDNCKGDPCAAAGKIKDNAKNLKIHTIAFDRKEKVALEALSCIAEKTGGSFASATNESELQAALDKAIGLALAPEEPAAAAQPATAAASETNNELAAAPPATNPGGVASESAADQIQSPTMPVPAPEAAVPPRPELERRAAAPALPVAITFSALLTEEGPDIKHGLVWRIFEAKPGSDGRYKLLETFRDASPTTKLVPGQYLVNAAYGLSHLTKMVTVRGDAAIKETLVLNAGGLRLGASLADGKTIPPNSVRYDIFGDEADQFGNRQKIMGDAKPGLIIRLNAGAYHIVSVYGDANAVVRADVTVEPGKLTEATINHAAARVTFKLVMQPGGEALANAQWNILTPGGDVVKESAGALPTHILAAGRYTVLARYQGKNYSRDFTIASGDVKQIEVVIR